MKRMRWLKRVAAIVLTAALCFGMTPIGNLSGIFEVRADGTNLLSNGDFETGAVGDWQASVALDQTSGVCEVKNDSWASSNTSYFLHLANYTGTDNLNVTVTQSVSLAAGTYTASIASAGANQGSSASNLVLSAVSGTNTLDSSTLTLGGWDTWTTSTITFTLPEAATVTIGVTGTLADSSYCDLDNAELVLNTSSSGDPTDPMNDIPLTNGDFETGDTSKWSMVGFSQVTTSGTVNTSKLLNLWLSDTDATFGSASYTVALTAGTYKFGFAISGAIGELSYSVKKADGTTLTSDSGTFSPGWDVWNTYSTEAFVLDTDTTVTFTLSGTVAAGAWGYLDNLTLTGTGSIVTETNNAVEAEINVEKVSGLSNDFIMGMDISSVVSEFNSGVTYKDFDGNTISNVTDFCKFLKTCGVTHVRVRIWNNPYDDSGNGYGGGNNDVATAVTIAEACKAADLKMLLDFHCSDFWTDPGKQQAPKAWAGYSVDEKAAALQSFLTTSLTAVKATGVDIAMVQVGNETTGGFIGETSVVNMCTLFNAGAAAVRSFDPNIKVVIHVTNPESSKMTTWAKNLSDNSVDYDILATSYYPSWHGTFANLKSQLATVKNTYGKDVMVAETSYAFTLDDTDGHTNTVRQGTNDTMMCETQYPFSVQGQASYMRDLIAAVNEVGGLGVYWWESAWITVGDTTGKTGDELTARVDENKALWEANGSGWASSFSASYDPDDAGKWYGGSAVDNQAMFGADGSALASINVWKYVRTGAVSVHTEVESISSVEETIETGGTYTLPNTIKVTYNSGAVDETVTWNEADKNAIRADQAGTYVVNGTVAFSKAVDQGTYTGQTSASVTYTLTVKAPNLIGADSSFENGSSNFTGLDTTGKGIDGETPYDGSKCLHWYLASAGTGSVTYKGTGSNGITLEPGAYTFEVMAQGNDGDQVALSVLDHEKNSVLSTGTATSVIGWANWVTPSVSFTVTETTTVNLGITIGIQAGGWGTVDCMYLYQTEAYASHQVTFVDGTKSFAKKVADGRSATAPVWSKAGYSLGWDKSFANITSDITVNAVWTPIEYQITYSVNGGVNSAENPTEYTVESGTVELKNPSKKGYIFKGWYKEASFENPVSSVQALEDGNITVYAKWEEIQMSIGDVESEDGTLDADSLVEELKSKGAFTPAEILQISLGGSVSVYMKVDDKSDTVSETDKNEVLGKLESEGYDWVGCYLDLQLIKQIGSNPAENITELDQPIRITIVIPEDLINTIPNTTRTYAIVRVHVNESGEISTELIPGSFDPSTNEFTFETDRFSTYAIVYKDTVPSSTPGQTPPSASGESVSGTTPGAAAASEAVSTTLASPDTSDNQSVAPFILMMAAAFVMMGAAAFARRRRTR